MLKEKGFLRRGTSGKSNGGMMQRERAGDEAASLQLDSCPADALSGSTLGSGGLETCTCGRVSLKPAARGL